MSPITPQTARSTEAGLKRLWAPHTACSTEARPGGFGRFKPLVRKKPDQAVSGASNSPFDRSRTRRFRAPQTARSTEVGLKRFWAPHTACSTEARPGGFGRLKPPV
ncbi:hypothetical protein AVEN_146804-1, partial [Araneus ventricosus]